GCPKKIETSTSTYLTKLVIKGKLPIVVDAYKYLRNAFNIKCSTQTIQNAFKRAGLKSAIKVKKP
ncbi:hypothetical protein BDA99DRAFT_437244, partial [Phascolomyces articulosus]